MREILDENREQSLQNFETFLRDQVHANFDNPHFMTNAETVMGFYDKVDPDEALRFLENDVCWERTIAEIKDIPNFKEAWEHLRQELIAAFTEKRVWKEWRGKMRGRGERFRRVLKF